MTPPSTPEYHAFARGHALRPPPAQRPEGIGRKAQRLRTVRTPGPCSHTPKRPLPITRMAPDPVFCAAHVSLSDSGTRRCTAAARVGGCGWPQPLPLRGTPLPPPASPDAPGPWRRRPAPQSPGAWAGAGPGGICLNSPPIGGWGPDGLMSCPPPPTAMPNTQHPLTCLGCGGVGRLGAKGPGAYYKWNEEQPHEPPLLHFTTAEHSQGTSRRCGRHTTRVGALQHRCHLLTPGAEREIS